MSHFTEVQTMRMQRKNNERAKKNNTAVREQIWALNMEAYGLNRKLLCISHHVNHTYVGIHNGSGYHGCSNFAWIYYSLSDNEVFRFVEVKIVHGMNRLFDHGYLSWAEFELFFPEYVDKSMERERQTFFSNYPHLNQ